MAWMNGDGVVKRIGIIGCGALATVFLEHFREVLAGAYCLSGIHCRSEDKGRSAAGRFGTRFCRDIAELLETAPDIVVEFASGEAVRAYAEDVLRAGADFVCVSVGALADAGLRARLISAARASGAKLIVPCGALGGLDLMRTAAAMGGQSASIETVKAPKGLAGAPGLQGRALSGEKAEVVFEGGVQAAIAGFPKNVNVAVATALASETADLSVIIRSEPGAKGNCHTVRLENPAMQAEIRIRSKPDPDNPRSSISTAWSVLALLKDRESPIQFF